MVFMGIRRDVARPVYRCSCTNVRWSDRRVRGVITRTMSFSNCWSTGLPVAVRHKVLTRPLIDKWEFVSERRHSQIIATVTQYYRLGPVNGRVSKSIMLRSCEAPIYSVGSINIFSKYFNFENMSNPHSFLVHTSLFTISDFKCLTADTSWSSEGGGCCAKDDVRTCTGTANYPPQTTILNVLPYTFTGVCTNQL